MAHSLRKDVTTEDPNGASGDRGELSDRPVDRLRRDVLGSLEEAGVPLSLADLAVELARREADAEDDVWERAECLWIELYHNHAPALEAAGLVEYDQGRRTVSLSPAAMEREFDGATCVAS